IYMQAALDHLRAQGETLNDEDIARLSPLCHGHINMLGHYSFTLAELVTKEPRQPGGCKLKTAPVRPVVAARPAEYVCSEDLFY
ncbi:Tn3 family transposase, partial [Escherichia coli]|uniref:Tn3 family transposase n=1 Tax=Escherichia coli TaxID=562 RepID=UPI0020405428